MKTPTVAVVFSRLGPYHVARLRAATTRLAAEGRALLGIEVAATDRDYAWEALGPTPGVERLTLFPGERYDAIGRARIARALIAALDRSAPEGVAIPGWSQPEALAAMRWCQRHRAVPILMSESARDDAPRQAWRESIKAARVRHCASALVGGRRHADYVAELGIPPARVCLGYDVVDNDYFSRGAERARANAASLRATHNLPERFFLASCRFVPKKNLPGLLAAFARFRKRPAGVHWHLVLCGDGPQRAALQSQAAALELADCTHFPGFVAYADLPVYYGLATAFVHASTVEQWGLVVNEAMAAGLPVLVSRRCGCVPELVQDGVNGFTFDPERVEDLANLLEKTAAAGSDRDAWGRHSRDIIRAWAPPRFAEGLATAFALGRDAPATPPWWARAALAIPS